MFCWCGMSARLDVPEGSARAREPVLSTLSPWPLSAPGPYRLLPMLLRRCSVFAVCATSLAANFLAGPRFGGLPSCESIVSVLRPPPGAC